MKPKLKEDVHFVPWAEGAFVWMTSRRDGGFTVRVRDAYVWLTRIRPFLTGEHTLDELGHSLSEPRRNHVKALIDLLHREGAVRDAADDRARTLSADVIRHYARTIAFIARSADSPEYRFQRYRESRPLVLGSGALVGPLAGALVASGVERVELAVTPDRATDVARLRACLAHRLGVSAAEQVVQVPHGAALERLDADAVLHVSDVLTIARARRAASLCASHRLCFGQATVIGDEAFVGPVGPGERLPRSWERSLLTSAEEARDAGLRGTPLGCVSQHLFGPAAAIVANHLCAAFLRHVAGLSSGGAGEMLVIDLARLTTRTNAIVDDETRATEVRA